jgi:histidyl-tRNA synthetase
MRSGNLSLVRNEAIARSSVTDLQPARGTHDLIGEDQRRHHHVVETARRIAASYGFDEWITPIFEDTRVFSRTLGETSDVVTKEMYTFDDRGGDSITLRPEATAGVCRALVTNGLTQSLPQKVFYAGPMFRYERPQKGRYRQFHQIDIELIGPAEPLADAEVIACGWDILKALGVHADTVLELNTLGDGKPRRLPGRAGRVFHRAPGRRCRRTAWLRLDRNPMRILDSKDERDRRIVAGAPTIAASDRGRRGVLREGAGASDGLRRAVPGKPAHRPRPGLLRPHRLRVRHLQTGRAGHGDGGRPLRRFGRRDGRSAHPAVGWAAGMERLAMLLDATPSARAGRRGADRRRGEAAAIGILQSLRAAGIRAEMAYRGNLRRRMERANRIDARAAVILGADDLAQGVAQVKDLAHRRRRR